MVEMFMGIGEIKDGKFVSLQSGQIPQVYVGLDAGKWISPSVGCIAICYDTGKTYECFVNGIWNILSSPAVEKYSNHLGTTDNIMGVYTSGLGSATTDAANHKMTLSTGAGIGVAQYLANWLFIPQNNYYVFNAKVNGISNGTGGTARTTSIGVSGNGGATFNQLTDNTWTVNTNDGNTEVVTAITAIANNDLLTITGTLLNSSYFVNGKLIVTHTKTIGNSMSIFAGVNGAGAVTGARTISIDYISLEVFQ